MTDCKNPINILESLVAECIELILKISQWISDNHNQINSQRVYKIQVGKVVMKGRKL